MKGAKVALEEEFRYGSDAAELYYQHYDMGLVISPSDYFDLGAFYRLAYELRKGKFMEESRPHIDGTVKFDLYGFAIDDRNRFEYRIYRYQDENCRYRNKVTLKLPWKFTPLEIRPYFSNEIFVRLDDSAVFNQNRFSSGLGMQFAGFLKGEVYYMLKSDKNRNKWTDANILGLKLKAVF